MGNTYMAHEVADILGVSTSALRKWSPSLERAGYRFIRDEHGRRIYQERDLAALRRMRELLQSGMGMENAAKSVWGLYRTEFESSSVALSVHQEKDENAKREQDERLQKLEARMDELVELNKKLVQQLHQRDETDRERYARFDHLLSEVAETRRMLAAAQEKEQEQPEKKWWQFWKS